MSTTTDTEPGYPARRCGHKHKTLRTLLACHDPGITSVTGHGEWAFFHEFSVPLGGGRRDRRVHVRLHPTEAEAREWADIDVPCSGTCRRHSVHRIVLA